MANRLPHGKHWHKPVKDVVVHQKSPPAASQARQGFEALYLIAVCKTLIHYTPPLLPLLLLLYGILHYPIPPYITLRGAITHPIVQKLPFDHLPRLLHNPAGIHQYKAA